MPKLQRWYKGFSYRGSPKKLLEQIANQVQEHNLNQVIPLLRIEKGVKPRNRKPFYFFIAIESTQPDEIPTEVSKSHLLELNYFKKPVKNPTNFNKTSLNYEEIKSMVGIAHDVHDYTHNIPYQPEPVTYDNPFDFIASSNSERSLSDDGKDFSQTYLTATQIISSS